MANEGVRHISAADITIYFNGVFDNKNALDKRFYIALDTDLEVLGVRKMLIRLSQLFQEAGQNKSTSRHLWAMLDEERAKKLTELGTNSHYKAKADNALLANEQGKEIMATLQFLSRSIHYYEDVMDHLRILFKACETIVGAEGVAAKVFKDR